LEWSENLADNFKEIVDVSVLKGLKGFVFDWSKQASFYSITVGLEEADRFVGLVEYERDNANKFNYIHLVEAKDDFHGKGIAGKLLAYVGLDSIKTDYDGFVVFESKTLLYDYYVEKYGAKPLGGRRLYFDTETTKALIRQYLNLEV
jgi:hypothetical protein